MLRVLTKQRYYEGVIFRDLIIVLFILAKIRFVYSNHNHSLLIGPDGEQGRGVREC